MNARTSFLNLNPFLILSLLLISVSGWADQLQNLSADNQTVAVPGKQVYQNVEIIKGAIVEYLPNQKDERIIGITCDTFLLDASSSIVYGATSSFGTTAPLAVNEKGTPDVSLPSQKESWGNGAGSYGGQGYNYFGNAKATYGSVSDYEIQQGSIGTSGETISMPFGGSIVTFEGFWGGRCGGRISIIANSVIIEGHINTDGESGYGSLCASPYPGYSGSGGGILIAAKDLTITSTAKITANGGKYPLKEHCYDSGRPYHYRKDLVGKRDGGGGRIKIFYEQGTISEDAVIEALGWEDGTVYIEQVESIERLMNPGDLSGDGKTNYEDLFLLHHNWQKEVTPIPTAVGE